MDAVLLATAAGVVHSPRRIFLNICFQEAKNLYSMSLTSLNQILLNCF